MTEIRPGLFVGDVEASKALPLGVTHVVIAAKGLERYHPVHYLELPLLDDSVDELLPHLPRCMEFMEKAGAVLVHCHAGCSRSPAVAIAFLMRRDRAGLGEILDEVRAKLPAAQPNPKFMEELQLWEDLGYSLVG